MTVKIALGSYEGNLVGWESGLDDPSLLRLRYAFNAHEGCMRAAKMDFEKNSTLLTCGTDESIQIFNLNTHKAVGVLLEHTDEVTTLEYFAGTNALSGDKRGKICIWRCHDWLCLHTMDGHTAAVNDIAVHDSGRLALSIGADYQLFLWDLTKGKPVFNTRTKLEPRRVRWAPGCNQFVIQYDYKVDVFDVSSGNVIRSVNSASKIQDCLFVDVDTIVMGCEDCCLRVVRMDTGSTVTVWQTDHSLRIRAISSLDGFDVDEEHATNSDDDESNSVDAPNKNVSDLAAKRKCSFTTDSVTNALAKKKEIKGVRLPLAKRYLVTADPNGVVALWSLSTLLSHQVKDTSNEDDNLHDEFGNKVVNEPEAEHVDPLLTLRGGAGGRATCLTSSVVKVEQCDAKNALASAESTLDISTSPAKSLSSRKSTKNTKTVKGSRTRAEATKDSNKQRQSTDRNIKKSSKLQKGNDDQNKTATRKSELNRGVTKDGVVSFVDRKEVAKLRHAQSRKQKKRATQVAVPRQRGQSNQSNTSKHRGSSQGPSNTNKRRGASQGPSHAKRNRK